MIDIPSDHYYPPVSVRTLAPLHPLTTHRDSGGLGEAVVVVAVHYYY